MHLTKNNNLVIFFFIVSFFSCKKKEEILPEILPEIIKSETPVAPVKPKFFEENTWIYNQMKNIYLWEDKMPEEKDTDKNLNPEDYFYTLTNNSKQTDWVSYIKMNKSDIFDFWDGNMNSFGFKYRKIIEPNQEIKLAVSIVFQNSPAQKGNLWRGDIITKINGNVLTEKNLENLLNIPNVEFTVIDTDNTTKLLKIDKTKFLISPIQDKAFFEQGKNKIAYFVYSQFLTSAEPELRALIGGYKAIGVNELILDLRFNPGGVTPNAEVLASLLVKNLVPKSTMYTSSWNKTQTELIMKKEGASAGIRGWTSETNNIGNLNRIFILTSKTSASSSEMIINCLRPFMEVIVIGDNTFGKNLINIIITDETGKFPFAIMPAFSQMYNAKGESNYGTKDGFTPNYKIEDNVIPFFPLGNPNETLLKKALSLINNETGETPIQLPFKKVTFLDRYHHFDSGSAFYLKAN